MDNLQSKQNKARPQKLADEINKDQAKTSSAKKQTKIPTAFKKAVKIMANTAPISNDEIIKRNKKNKK